LFQFFKKMEAVAIFGCASASEKNQPLPAYASLSEHNEKDFAKKFLTVSEKS